MGKVRVHELAKKLNISNHDLISKLKVHGITVRTHSSSVDEGDALKALGMSADGKSNAKLRPRTVLRRRRPEKEVVLESVEPQEKLSTETVAEDKSALPHEVVSPKDSEVVAASPVESSAETISEVSGKEILETSKGAVLEPDVAVADAQAEAPVAIASEKVGEGKEPKKVIGKSEVTRPINNVVRVIDAEAIKARLASEGRTFRPRGPRPAERKRFSEVKEVVFRRGPAVPSQRMPESAPSAVKPGFKPSKRKSREIEREKKELGSGGYELWLSPGRKRRSSKKGVGKGTVITQAAAHKRVVELSGPVTVNDLAHRMSVKAGQVVTTLMGMGMMVTINQPIDPETAAIVANEFNFEVKNVAFEETEVLKEEVDAPETLETRAPVVTVMGHVDHGKTSILDAIKNSDVVSGEAGGITQHIGAYSVETAHGKVTFLDTPGHEAFTSMRARGAEITDIVVLVVAADDGVMPQTIEAIDHAKAAKVPIVVAVNKMDSANAKPDRVLQQLAERDVVSEEWGGDVQIFKVSALKKQGLDELTEGIAMLAEILELKANPNKLASGFVIEAKLDKGRGPVATVLIQSGTLKKGDMFVAGEYSGRVRAMYDSNGDQISEAGPSMAAQILGLSGVPNAGDKINAVKDDKIAKTIIQHRTEQNRDKALLKTSRVSLESFLQSKPADKSADLRLIVKADVFGSVEALTASLQGLSTKLVNVDIVHSGVGTITENDVNLALASRAIVIGFNSKPDAKANQLATQEKVDIRTYKVIYEVLDEVKQAMAGLLAPVIEENYLGKAEVRMVISAGKAGMIAGCYVVDGKIVRSAKIKIKRADEVMHTGSIASLKRFKDDVKEVSSGYECGISVEGYSDFKEGDLLECFELKEVAAVDLGERLQDSAKKVNIEPSSIDEGSDEELSAPAI